MPTEAYYTVNDHDMYVYVVFVYMHVTIINEYSLTTTTTYIGKQGSRQDPTPHMRA